MQNPPRRYLLDLKAKEIAKVLGRSQTDVTMLQSRALRFLRDRLTALGRAPEQSDKPAPMRRTPQKARVLRNRRFSLLGWRRP